MKYYAFKFIIVVGHGKINERNVTNIVIASATRISEEIEHYKTQINSLH